jgi:hypothetical protein
MDCSSSVAVTPLRAKAQLSGTATQLENMPENTLSESVYSSKSLYLEVVIDARERDGISSPTTCWLSVTS